MPTNKNAMMRCKILDELLSNQNHCYSLDELTEEVNNRLIDEEVGKTVTRRCIEKDIYFLEYILLAEIERYTEPDYNEKTKKNYTKRCLKYKDPSFSIFKKELTDDERYLLSEVLSILGQFDGLPNLDGLEKLRLSLKINEREPVIGFTRNPINPKNPKLFGELFTAISQKQVLKIKYQTFNKPDDKVDIIVHPYLLKEYNKRWFLYATTESDGKLLNFGLERIDNITPLKSHKYVEFDGNLNEIFDDIIGVTYYPDKPVEKILFWVNEGSKKYVATKPLHDSQIEHKNDSKLRQQYPNLENGTFFSIDCIENYELIRELSSFGSNLLVLLPENIQNKVYQRCSDMVKCYDKIMIK